MKPNHCQAVFDALPGTVAEIMAKTGVCRATVFHWVKVLCQQSKARVKRWIRTTGLLVPYYVQGEGKSVPRPAALSTAQYTRRYYVKHRQKLEMELRASARAARANAASTLVKPQSWLSALGGM